MLFPFRLTGKYVDNYTLNWRGTSVMMSLNIGNSTTLSRAYLSQKWNYANTTKWILNRIIEFPFRHGHAQKHLPQWKSYNFYWNVTEICFFGAHWHYYTLSVSDNGLALNGSQVINWNHIDKDLWRHMVTPGHNEFRDIKLKISNLTSPLATHSMSHDWLIQHNEH